MRSEDGACKQMHPHMYQNHPTGPAGVLNFAVIAVDWADVDTPSEVSAGLLELCAHLRPRVTTSNTLTSFRDYILHTHVTPADIDY
jgi:hypothetical protein